MIETNDNVFNQLVFAGGEKIDWIEGEERKCPNGSWWVDDPVDHQLFDVHLQPTAMIQMQHLAMVVELNQTAHAHLHLLFDPETRRIEAAEVSDPSTGGTLLTLLFWPGLISARKLAIATMTHWLQVIDDGWLDSPSALDAPQ
jgi:hypothetical protein